MTPWYPIRTERLLLRPYRETDHDALAALLTRQDVSRFLLFDARTPEQIPDSLALRMTVPPLDTDGQAVTLAAELLQTGQVIGDVSLFRVSVAQRQGELGFVFHPDFHGHGYAGEAAKAVLRAAFDELDMHRVIGRCDHRNTASAALMKRLGMRQEAHFVRNEYLKGEWTDELVFALLQDE